MRVLGEKEHPNRRWGLRMSFNKLITVVGPTAVGKTRVAIEIAKILQTVVVSADSRQFYKEMSIGTAKPSSEELASVPHYFIDSHQIKDNLSAGDFEREALALLGELFVRYSQVVLVGGSGLFVNALRQGLDDLPGPKPGVREKWNQIFAEQGIEALQQALAVADPVYYEEVDLQNPQRLIRALEVWESTGKPFSSFRKRNASEGSETANEHSETNRRPFDTLMIGLDMDREQLYERINERVDLMMQSGLLDEVRSLYPHRHLPALKTVGYAELFDYLDGHVSLEEAVEKIKQNTRRYAKRQLTWFRKDADTAWFDPSESEKIHKYILNAIDQN